MAEDDKKEKSTDLHRMPDERGWGGRKVQSRGQRNKKRKRQEKTEDLKNKRTLTAWAVTGPWTEPWPSRHTTLRVSEHSAKPYSARTLTGIQVHLFPGQEAAVVGHYTVYPLERRSISQGGTL